MSSIKVYMKDGTVHDFPHKGRSGGSYTKTLVYKAVRGALAGLRLPGFPYAANPWR